MQKDDLRQREVCVDLYGQKRALCTVHSSQVGDVLAVVSSLRRKARMPDIGDARTAAVDDALKSGGCGGIDGLRERLAEWRRDWRASIDVDSHYDARRVCAYTDWNKGPQAMLARRCLELAELAPSTGSGSCGARLSGRAQVRRQRERKRGRQTQEDEEEAGPAARGSRGLAVDVGCGSGLSSAALVTAGFETVGVDLSTEMLRAAAARPANGPCGVARVDMRQGLPVRPAAADVVFSVGALQFLLAVDHSARKAFFGSCRASLRPGGVLAAQFCPSDATEAESLLAAATASGMHAFLVLDQPHRTAGRRWFLLAYTVPPTPRPLPCLMYGGGVCCGLSARTEIPEAGSHEEWLCAEHCRYAHGLLRRRRRTAAAGESTAMPAADAAAADRLCAAVPEVPSGGPAALRQCWAAVHAALHPSGDST